MKTFFLQNSGARNKAWPHLQGSHCLLSLRTAAPAWASVTNHQNLQCSRFFYHVQLLGCNYCHDTIQCSVKIPVALTEMQCNFPVCEFFCQIRRGSCCLPSLPPWLWKWWSSFLMTCILLPVATSLLDTPQNNNCTKWTLKLCIG